MPEPNHITIQTTRLQCRHIFTDGHRCGSPCLRQQEFCFFHHTTRRPTARRTRSPRFRLNPPEDRSAIQLSIGEILHRLAADTIEPKRAALLLYALQIASNNLPRAAQPTPGEPVPTVDEISIHPQLGPLAPVATLPEDKPSTTELLLTRWEQQKCNPGPDSTPTK